MKQGGSYKNEKKKVELYFLLAYLFEAYIVITLKCSRIGNKTKFEKNTKQ